jgi:hypothetical protein
MTAQQTLGLIVMHMHFTGNNSGEKEECKIVAAVNWLRETVFAH